GFYLENPSAEMLGGFCFGKSLCCYDQYAEIQAFKSSETRSNSSSSAHAWLYFLFRSSKYTLTANDIDCFEAITE
ncbi:MAG: hypothetical protein V4448_14755, partial [Pseudomonadota bacterium]